MHKYFIYALSFTLLTTQGIYADATDLTEIPPLPVREVTPAATDVVPETEKPKSPLEPESPDPTPEPVTKPKPKPISAFTGKITKNKVRLRAQPSLDSIILRELNSGEMVMVTGENEDFYAIQPPTDIKAYIYRTFVLDNVVEGNHVNVRLEPDLSAPVIAQMNSGDRISGFISNRDKKWIEMALPESVRFYISKDYVEKIGDASYISKYNKRTAEVAGLLSTAILNSQTELQKPFNQISIDSITKDLQKVINQFSDFPNEVAKAKELLTTIQTAYLTKKVAFMESHPQVATNQTFAPQAPVKPVMSITMAAWEPVEQNNYNEWSAQNGNASMEEYYHQQADSAVTLRGIIESYSKPIKNKPGDFVLLNVSTHLPVAYLYSTKVNLQDLIGQEVTLQGVTRDSRHFAYPAYFVLSIE